MGESKRKHHPNEQKVAILKEHLLDGRPVSLLCEKHGIAPGLFYCWQKQFFENGSAAFERDSTAEQRALERKVEALTEKLAKKDGVIAEVTEEYVKLKKEFGEP